MAPTKTELEHLYWECGLSGREIARRLAVPSPTVFSWLKRGNIRLRTRRDATHLYQRNNPESLHAFIKGGIKSHFRSQKQSPKLIAKRVASRKGYHPSQETIDKMRKSNQGRKLTQEQREASILRLMKGELNRPTKLESKFEAIVSKYNLPYKYVGDGYTWIAGRCPDFLNINGNKTVVEIFGRYWHDPSRNVRVKSQHTEQATISHYAKYGFNCVVVWEEELKNELAVVAKVKGG